jgi:hypothetical protein
MKAEEIINMQEFIELIGAYLNVEHLYNIEYKKFTATREFPTEKMFFKSENVAFLCTGFGLHRSCIMCTSGVHKHFELCNCAWAVLTNNDCVGDENKTTYDLILHSNSKYEYIKACKDRAEYMIDVLKKNGFDYNLLKYRYE